MIKWMMTLAACSLLATACSKDKGGSVSASTPKAEEKLECTPSEEASIGKVSDQLSQELSKALDAVDEANEERMDGHTNKVNFEKALSHSGNGVKICEANQYKFNSCANSEALEAKQRYKMNCDRMVVVHDQLNKSKEKL